MKIDLSPLLSAETTKLTFDLEDTLEDELLGSEITFTAPIRFSGEITNQAGYMHLCADAFYSYEARCDRCLVPILKSDSVRIEKDVASAARINAEENDQYLLYDGSDLCVDEAIADLVYLSLPDRHLCREDCRGFCLNCKVNLNVGECKCQKKTVDPRLAVLAKLLEDQNE